jgi:hypothetical protein
VIWLLAFAPIVATLVALGYLAHAAWRKARAALRTTGELRGRVDTLAVEAGALADRLDAVDVGPPAPGVRRP